MKFRVSILPQARRDIDRNADWWAEHHDVHGLPLENVASAAQARNQFCSAGQPDGSGLCQNRVDNFSLDVGQSKIATAETIRELRVVEPQ